MSNDKRLIDVNGVELQAGQTIEGCYSRGAIYVAKLQVVLGILCLDPDSATTVNNPDDWNQKHNFTLSRGFLTFTGFAEMSSHDDTPKPVAYIRPWSRAVDIGYNHETGKYDPILAAEQKTAICDALTGGFRPDLHVVGVRVIDGPMKNLLTGDE